MYLIDYNNCKLVNPAVSLAESAYSFSFKDNNIDYDNYTKYLEIYLKRYGQLTSDYKEALYVSQNKRLKRLVNAINESLKTKDDYSVEIVETLKEILLFNANVERMYETYINIVKK